MSKCCCLAASRLAPLPTLLLLLLPFFVCGAATTQWRTEEVVSCPGLSLPPLLPWEEEFHYDLSAAFPHSSRSRILCAGYKCTWITKRDRVSLSPPLSLSLHFSLSLCVRTCGLCLWQDQLETLAAKLRTCHAANFNSTKNMQLKLLLLLHVCCSSLRFSSPLSLSLLPLASCPKLCLLYSIFYTCE